MKRLAMLKLCTVKAFKKSPYVIIMGSQKISEEGEL